jgi:hypothetical protein
MPETVVGGLGRQAADSLTRVSKRRLSIGALAALAGALILPSGTGAWAPAESARIHPGVQTFTGDAQCTANFVFKRPGRKLPKKERRAGKRRKPPSFFLGQAAHCAGTGSASETDGCDADSLPLRTPVRIEGATRPGVLVYSSWLSMQRAGERDRNACEFNDFALVRIPRVDLSRVNPSLPVFGGPAGVGEGRASEDVYTYGNSGLRDGLPVTSPKRGKVVERNFGGWNYDLYTFTPGLPGDSGSAFLNSGGAAMGVLSTLALAPYPASNGVSDLRLMLRYARHGFRKLTLVRGTEPFGPLALGPVR